MKFLFKKPFKLELTMTAWSFHKEIFLVVSKGNIDAAKKMNFAFPKRSFFLGFEKKSSSDSHRAIQFLVASAGGSSFTVGSASSM